MSYNQKQKQKKATTQQKFPILKSVQMASTVTDISRKHVFILVMLTAIKHWKLIHVPMRFRIKMIIYKLPSINSILAVGNIILTTLS